MRGGGCLATGWMPRRRGRRSREITVYAGAGEGSGAPHPFLTAAFLDTHTPYPPRAPWRGGRCGGARLSPWRLCAATAPKRRNTADASTNNLFVGLVAFGEGWHNNHHKFAFSARHGLRWWQFDMTWIVLRAMRAIGLVADLKLPKEHR